MEFDKLIDRIKSGNLTKPCELLPHLCLENVEERCYVNFRLAEAYSESGDFQQAKTFINRSWILSKFSPEVLPLYIKIHLALNDIGTIRDAYKRLGMMEASKGDITGALKYFNLWQYAFATHEKLDKYVYDFDILERIGEMAKPWRYKDYDRPRRSDNRKIRLAYLAFGITHLNSVLIKINHIFARYHDKSRFEVNFFVPDPRFSIYRSQQAIENIKMFHKYDCQVTLAGGFKKGVENLLTVGRKIHQFKPDVLITSALLAEFEHYFIACLRPAPIIIGLLQGPPAQFTAPCLDWSISWSKHPLIDCPCDCSLVHIGLDLPDTDSITPYRKKDFKIPDDSRILLSAGRYVKFQNIDFWKSIISILSAFPMLCYVVVGVSREELPFLDALVPPELEEKIKLLGWREDQLSIYSLADVVIDTFPSGGGHVLIETMALGIPFVSFENNYMREFDQTDWSVADEFVSIPELLIDRGDFKQFKSIVSKLLEDKAYHNKMGRLCKEQIYLSMGSPDKKVREFENVLLTIMEKKENHSKDQVVADKNNGSSGGSMDKLKRLIFKAKSFRPVKRKGGHETRE